MASCTRKGRLRWTFELILALLAVSAAGVQVRAETIQIHGTLRDFCTVEIPDVCRKHPDFENKIGVEKGIVDKRLGTDRKPVYALEGKPSQTTSGKANFYQWFRDVPGVNLTIPFTLKLSNEFSANKRVFGFIDEAFFPLNGKGFDVGKPNTNYSFTLELHARFKYRGGEILRFSGDDDVWIFINGLLAIDLGGVHPTQFAEVDLDEESRRLGIAKGHFYDFDLFFAERHSVDSTFNIETSIRFVDILP